jgi:hypothetical protein
MHLCNEAVPKRDNVDGAGMDGGLRQPYERRIATKGEVGVPRRANRTSGVQLDLPGFDHRPDAERLNAGGADDLAQSCNDQPITDQHRSHDPKFQPHENREQRTALAKLTGKAKTLQKLNHCTSDAEFAFWGIGLKTQHGLELTFSTIVPLDVAHRKSTTSREVAKSSAKQGSAKQTSKTGQNYRKRRQN